MFGNLTNFGYQRNWKEAVGFYIAYFLLIIIAGALLGGVSGLFLPPDYGFSEGFNFGMKIGAVGAVVITLLLSFLVLKGKNLLQHFGLIVLALLGGLLAFWGGAFLGLIPVAYLTTRSTRSQPNIPH